MVAVTVPTELMRTSSPAFMTCRSSWRAGQRSGRQSGASDVETVAALVWVATTDLPRNAGHPFYERLNRILSAACFDAFVEGLCARFYTTMGRPSLAPGRYFRLLLLGYFEGLDSERAIAWRAADSLRLRAFLHLAPPAAPPDHSTISRTRRRFPVETHQAVFTWVLQQLADPGVRHRDAGGGGSGAV